LSYEGIKVYFNCLVILSFSEIIMKDGKIDGK